MNPVLSDFLRRWKGLLGLQFVITTIIWTMHGKGAAGRVHLEMLVAVAMSWDLMRGLIRAQLGLPGKRDALARGLWFSVVGLGSGTHCAAMMLGAFVMAPLFGLPVLPGMISLHAVISLLMAGTIQYLLSGLPGRAAQTTAGQIRDGIFGALWGLSIWGTMWVSLTAPESWAELHAGGVAILGLLGFLTVFSWWTTHAMLDRRCVPRPGAAILPPPAAAGAGLAGPVGWRLWLGLELKVQAFLFAMILLASGAMIGAMMFSRMGVRDAASAASAQFSQFAIGAAMFSMPLFGILTGSLRLLRTLPVPLGWCATLCAARPLIACLNLFTVLILMRFAVGADVSMAGSVFCLCIFLGSLMSLGQALMIRAPSILVGLPMVMLISPMGMFLIPGPANPLKLSISAAGLATAAAVILPLAWWLHLRWLRRSSRIYRNTNWLASIAGSRQR